MHYHSPFLLSSWPCSGVHVSVHKNLLLLLSDTSFPSTGWLFAKQGQFYKSSPEKVLYTAVCSLGFTGVLT